MRRGLLPLAIAALLPRPAAPSEASEGPGAYRFGEVIVVTGRSKGVEATGT